MPVGHQFLFQEDCIHPIFQTIKESEERPCSQEKKGGDRNFGA